MISNTRLAIEACASKYQFVGSEATHSKRNTWFTPKPTKAGYPAISFRARKLGITQKVEVHRIVGFQKFGEKIFEPGIMIRHKDNNKLNFSPDNLLLGTALENHLDNEKHVIDRLYSQCRKMAKEKRKLSDIQIQELRELRKLGMSLSKLAIRFGSCKSAVSMICSGATYRDSMVS